MIVSLAAWKVIARLGFAASDDPDRPILTAIKLTLGPSLLAGAATDSHILALNHIEPEREPEDPDHWEGLVRGRQALCVEKDVRSLERYRNKKHNPDQSLHLRVIFGDESVEVTLAEDGSMFDTESISRRLDLIDGTFPDYSSLLKTREPGAPEYWVNPELVTRLGKTVDDGAWPLQFRIGAGRAPIEASAKGDDNWRALLMPVLTGETIG